MVTGTHIKIWGHHVGAAIWDENRQVASFEYDPQFRRSGLDLSPLKMPLDSPRIFSFGDLDRQTFLGLPGLLADALPDAYGKALLDRWLADNGRNQANPVERLCYQGSRSMGALEFEPAERIFPETSESVEIDSLVKIARRVITDRQNLHTRLGNDARDALREIIRVGTSAGGARAKAVIAFNPTTREVRSGQVAAPQGFEHWLLKLDGVTNRKLGDPTHYGRIEYAYYQMACKAGIVMMDSQLLEENGRAHFMTKRFDRIGANQKLHTQTLCGLAHYDYRMPHAYSYEQAFQVMRQLRLPYSDAEQQFRRMVFNILGRNQDDHTKNISFIMDQEGCWSLSPAYDVSWAYNPAGAWTSSHQMTVNGKWENISREDMLTVARSMNIRRPQEIIEAVRESLAEWPRLAAELGIPRSQIRRIGATMELKG